MWNALLDACVRCADFRRAEATYAAGLEERLAPDAATVCALVRARSAAGDPASGAALCASALAAGLVRPSPRLAAAAICAAGRGGDPALAWRLHAACASGGAPPDAAVYAALIDACGADADSATRAFLDADAAGLKPHAHEPSLCALLCAYAKARQPARALLLFDSARRHWPGRRPPDAAYLLLRDAAAAAGDEAAARTVAALMAAEMRRGRDSRPGKPGGGADGGGGGGGRLAASAAFSALGRAWVTANGEAEAEAAAAVAGGAGEAAAAARAAAALLAGAGPELCARLGGAYVPDLSCVQLAAGGDGPQRARLLASHCEKKALGALLIRAGAAASAPLRVRVNIRMCRDCHAAYEAASSAWGARLEVFDGHAHIFEAGRCSCGGLWR